MHAVVMIATDLRHSDVLIDALESVFCRLDILDLVFPNIVILKRCIAYIESNDANMSVNKLVYT